MCYYCSISKCLPNPNNLNNELCAAATTNVHPDHAREARIADFFICIQAIHSQQQKLHRLRGLLHPSLLGSEMWTWKDTARLRCESPNYEMLGTALSSTSRISYRSCGRLPCATSFLQQYPLRCRSFTPRSSLKSLPPSPANGPNHHQLSASTHSSWMQSCHSCFCSAILPLDCSD